MHVDLVADVVRSDVKIPVSYGVMIPFNQIVALISSVTAMYSASVVDNATTGYRFAFQLTTPPYKVNTYLVKDFLLLKLSA